MVGRIRDLLVLLASDEDAARTWRDDPEPLISRFNLDAEDVARLRTLRIAQAATAPRRLEERLSRSGMGFAAALHDASQEDSGGGEQEGSESRSSRDTEPRDTGERSDDGARDRGDRETGGGPSRDGSDDEDETETARTDEDETQDQDQDQDQDREQDQVQDQTETARADDGDSADARPDDDEPDDDEPDDDEPGDDEPGDDPGGDPGGEVPPPLAPTADDPTADDPTADDLWDDLGDPDPDPGAGDGSSRPVEHGADVSVPCGPPSPDQLAGHVGPAVSLPVDRGLPTATAAGPVGAPASPAHGSTAASESDRPLAERLRDSLLDAVDGDPGVADGAAAPDSVDALAALILDVARDAPDHDESSEIQEAARALLESLGIDPEHPESTDPTGEPTPDPTAPDPTAPDPTAPDPTAPDPEPDPAEVSVVPPPRAEATDGGPAGTYRGGVVGQQVLPGEDGRLRVTYADGSHRDVTRTIVEGRATDTYTTADGVVVVETFGPAGGWTETDPDGTVTTATRSDGILTEETRHADGTSSTTRATLYGRFSGLSVLAGEEQYSTTVSDPSGATETIRVVGTADGGAVAVTSNPPATETTRVGLEDVENPDGSITRIFTFPDGRVDAFTVNAAGQILHHEVHESPALPTGADAPRAEPPRTGPTSVETGIHRGGVVLEIDHGTTRPGVVEQHLADGTVREILRSVDAGGEGPPTDRWTEPDGTTVVVTPTSTTITSPDGSRLDLESTPSTVRQTVLDADGASTTTYARPFSPGEEFLSTTVVAGPGLPEIATSVVVDADGESAIATIRTDTVVEHVRVEIDEVENADGSLTRVLTFPDGRIEEVTTDVDGGPIAFRGQPGTGEPAELPSDPGAEVNGTYRGGTVREEVVADPVAGDLVTLRTYADGTVVEFARSDPPGDADGTYVLPDGTRVTEQIWTDGRGGMTTSEAPDGTITQVSFDDTSYTSGVGRSDGSSAAATWLTGGSAEGALFETVTSDAAGHQVVTSVVPGTSDGVALASITTNGVEVTVRVVVDDIGNVDGTTTRVFTFPDGRTEAFTLNALGAAVHHEGHPGDGGILGDPPAVPAEGHHLGVISERVVTEQGSDPAGVLPATVEVLRADGTTQEIQRFFDADGSIFESWVEPDGTRISTQDPGGDGLARTSTEVRADGTSTVTRADSETGFAEDRTAPDGSTTWFRAPLDGFVPPAGGEIFRTVEIGVAGDTVTTSVVSTPDRGATAIVTRSDGLSATTRLEVSEVVGLDGSTTRVYTFPDGRTEAVTVDALTGQVIAHDAVPAGGPPVATEVAAPQVVLTVEPDGDRVEVRTHVDGSVETVTTSPLGEWYSSVTDAAGITLRTESFADGSIAKEMILADGSSTEVSRWPGQMVVSTLGTDGTEATTSISETGRTEKSLYDPVTQRTVTTIQEADGTERERLTAADGGSTTTSVSPDGTTSEVRVGADGSRAEETVRPDGSTTRTVVVPPLSETATERADGTIEVRTDNGAGTVSTLTTRPDGTYTRIVEKPDGVTVEENLTADGRLTSRATAPDGQAFTELELHRDGTRLESSRDASGYESYRTTRPDGTWWEKVELPGETVESRQEVGGAVTSTTTSFTGSRTEVTLNPDGSRLTTKYVDPGTRNFGLGQVPSDQPVRAPIEKITMFEAANGDSLTDIAYQGGRLLTVGTLADQGTMSVIERDVAGLVIGSRDGLPIPTTFPPPGGPFEPPPMPQPPDRVTVEASFAQAFEVRGQTSGAFDVGLFGGEGTAEGRIGGSHTGAASLTLGAGGLDASGSLTAYLGADGRVTGALSTPIGQIAGTASASAMAYASVAGSAHIGLDGVRVSVAAEARFAATADAEASGDLGFVSGEFGFEAGVGFGAEFEFDAELSWDRVGFDMEAGVGVGLWVGVSMGASISPSGIVDGFGDAGEWTGGAFADAGEWTGGAFADAGEWTAGAFADAGEWLGGAIGDAAKWTGGAAEDVVDFLTFWD